MQGDNTFRSLHDHKNMIKPSKNIDDMLPYHNSRGFTHKVAIFSHLHYGLSGVPNFLGLIIKGVRK